MGRRPEKFYHLAYQIAFKLKENTIRVHHVRFSSKAKMSLLWFKCLTIRLLKMFYQHHCFCHFNYVVALMLAMIYSIRKPVPAKLSYFSFNFNYGQEQIAQPKWKSCHRVEKLASDKICDSGEYQ